MNITFEKVTSQHLKVIFGWLAQDFIQEFWDNSQAHKDDIITFVEGRKNPSPYCEGKYVYWIAKNCHVPFALLMTIQETFQDDIDPVKKERLSKTGHTYSVDYMIGDQNFFGKGFGAPTLKEFIDFFRKEVDEKADTFFIDPSQDNPRAKHVYGKAGFDHVADFIMAGEVSGANKPHHLLIKKFPPTISIEETSMEAYPLFVKMGQFYEYEMSRYCGWPWEGENGGYPSSHLLHNFKTYFEDPSRKAYLIKVYNEIAGFALLNKATEEEASQWNMGEFFILAKFQGQGIGQTGAHRLWKKHPGPWEVAVIPENKSAVTFWEKAIDRYTNSSFKKTLKQVSYDDHQPQRIVFLFNTSRG